MRLRKPVILLASSNHRFAYDGEDVQESKLYGHVMKVCLMAYLLCLVEQVRTSVDHILQ
jgi:hypothetical protein